MVKQLINNILEIGLGGLLLWALFIFLVAVGVDYIFCNAEKILNIKHTAYWYDIVSHTVLLACFISGIYFYA